jgi:outer membrane biosynthesis protein TonB
VQKTELLITDTDNLLKQLGDILKDSDAEVVVKGESELVRRARMLLDLSVGRGEFTRQQADAVSFAAVQQEIVIPVVPISEVEPEVEEAPEPEVEVQPEPPAPEVSIAKKSKPKPVKKAKKADTLNLTEEDIAAAFGLGDDSDD